MPPCLLAWPGRSKRFANTTSQNNRRSLSPQVLEMKTESTEVLASLDTLSTMYTTNDATSRRQLKTTIEQRGIDTNRKFLHAADVVLQVC